MGTKQPMGGILVMYVVGFFELNSLHWWSPVGSQPQRGNTYQVRLGQNPGTHHFEAAWSPVLLLRNV